jgi:O-antigen/teichoic acid export membrane protein
MTPVMLPLLSRVQDLEVQFQKRCRFCVQIAAFILTPLGILFILIGGWFVVLVYGNQYLAAAPLMAWLGVTTSVHLLRVASTTIALSRGDSPNPTISNVFRASSFILAFIFAALGADIVWIAASGFVGEILATGISIWLLKHRLAISIQYFFKPLLVSAGWLILAALFWNAGLSGASIPLTFFVAVALSLIMTVHFLFFFPDFRKEITAMKSDLLSR